MDVVPAPANFRVIFRHWRASRAAEGSVADSEVLTLTALGIFGVDLEEEFCEMKRL